MTDDELIELSRKTGTRFSQKYPIRELAMEPEDIRQQAYIAGLDALKKYNGEGPIGSFVVARIWWALLAMFRRPGYHSGIGKDGAERIREVAKNAALSMEIDPQKHARAHDDDYSFIDWTATVPLSEREREVIHRFYWEEETLQQIGEHLGVTHQRVSAIRNDALKRIREVAV